MMNSSKMGEILSMVSALDGQLVTESKIAMWLEVLGDFTYEELVAVIKPAHIEADGVMQARDLFEQARRARAVASSRVDELEDGAQYVDAPSNLREMEAFYARLWEANPWDYEQKSGQKLRNGKDHYVPITGDELQRRIFDKAWELGWVIPAPRWDDVEAK
jgi:hypothetical protein